MKQNKKNKAKKHKIKECEMIIFHLLENIDHIVNWFNYSLVGGEHTQTEAHEYT